MSITKWARFPILVRRICGQDGSTRGKASPTEAGSKFYNSPGLMLFRPSGLDHRAANYRTRLPLIRKPRMSGAPSTALSNVNPPCPQKTRARVGHPGACHTPDSYKMVYLLPMARTNIDIDESLIRKARKLTRLKTKRQIVDKALELLVRTESRKGILRYYGTGIWEGDLKASRRNRV